MVQEERFDLMTREFPKQLDLAKFCIYGLSIVSASLFLFLPFINLLHPSPWQRWIGTIHDFGSLLAIATGNLAYMRYRAAVPLPTVSVLV
ncbi:hypothetical protein [Calothrix sp. PCC 7507]|uniref:hypothetical protein n=1 Tax=Calothrix sp. PCC 7507 TaxID=99598 RepID=UPI00029F29DE|nr:hypothetical protein [Calothrix sp. PCC 7507]AFY31365.1 hypothetical protein Cal7507_0884 [Calothrix sp. PCC 7507]